MSAATIDFNNIPFAGGKRFFADRLCRWTDSDEHRKWFLDKYVKDGRLRDDEVVENGLIMCKDCHTPRQVFIDEYFGWMYVDCSCQALTKAAASAKVKANNKARRLRAECFADYPAGVKKTFEGDDGRTPRTSKFAREYAERFEGRGKTTKGVLLWGDTSTGKTYLATAMMNALIDRGFRVRFVSTAEMVRSMNDFYRSNTAFDPYKNCDAIVLDDLGAENGSPSNIAAIGRFLDKTEQYEIPLIVTTNMSFRSLTTASDIAFRRIAHRILGRCEAMQMHGVDRRQGAMQF